MKIKQQKQIKEFLVESFGNDRGGKLFEMQDKVLGDIIGNTKGKTENQMKTLIQTILPRIALYKSLQAEGLSEDDVYKYMRKYMLEIVAAKKHSSTAKMEIVPGFYAIYSRVFLKIMQTTDLQESVQEHGKDYFNVTITKCLWHTACVENGCEELCRLFCDVDDVTYGGLKKIGFTRTKTLGYGGDCCDFHMFRK
ncbi:L-2-amino-thiazoline-4-carboxylic acid hydrolase [Ruminococcus sp.]